MRVPRRAPWIVWAFALVLLAGTFTLSGLNGRLTQEGWSNLVYVAIVMGYSTVGALLASRNPRNRVGPLLMAAGLSLVAFGFADEYFIYGVETRPGSLPGAGFAGILSNVAFVPQLVVLILVILLFPTGRVPSARWRHLPPTILGLFALGLAGTALAPGPLDTGVDAIVENPLGVEALRGVTDLAQGVGFVGLLPMLVAASVALILRYRRSQGEERQQIRWLVYVVTVVGLVILLSIAEELVPGETPLGDSLFISIVVLVGIGFPAAIGVAILKFRLYDLDLVVKKTVLYATVALLLTGAFLVVVATIGGAAIEADPFTVAALLAMGVASWPAIRLARHVADRVVYGRRVTPYEVLTEFSHRLGGSYGAQDVLPRMATILAGAVGATRAVVWLRIGSELRPAGIAPVDGVEPETVTVLGDHLPELPADMAIEVRDQGDLLGALTVSMPANDPINPSKERLVRDLASQAGLVLRNVALIEELRASRQRLVAAQDAERRRIERNIHDGAQQQLVALAVQLRLAEQLVGKDPEKERDLLSKLQAAAHESLEDLRDLARGIYPPLLADQGLAVALEAQARKSALPVAMEPDGIGRYPQDVESAVYFSVLEALNNVAKYAEASTATVRLRHDGDRLRFEVTDDGRGFDPTETGYGTGLQGMADRLDAIGGTIDVRSAPGEGTSVSGSLRIGPAERGP